ncbi:ABC transporter related [Beutenbergia cavernae DSM 12333]|uniref:ABC transporter related n=1 Tax=Beutenbergia cavernae (strain ATCC BAA-8 / DSM 12333 / CCUG 43141 / JCM 11478 / NBRC 16432 / NCIMB 13614 / HKI 0122) TaxID=471853 RepID=C5C409_BEUC1|nr:ABC transporter ATP-binding protein [Beutenbergia cavernae]ACQ79922.1 ABC transporter related [Beutenbergia cavernae DSM 12333]
MSTQATAPIGVADEENSHLDATRSRAIRRRSLKLLGSLLRPHRVDFTLAIVLVVVGQAARVAGPALVALAIDRGLPAALDGDWGPTWLVAGGYVGAAIAAGACTAAYIRMAAKVSQAVLLDLRQRVFRQTQLLSLEFHESYTSGRIISRQTSDLEALRDLLDSGITSLAQGFLFMAFTGVSLFILDWRSGLVLLVAVGPVWAITRWFQKRSQVLYRISRVASARLIVNFVENMTGIRAVQAFRRERYNEQVYGGFTEDYREISARTMRLNGVYDPGLTLIGNVTVAVALGFGAFRVLDGSLEVGVLVATLLYTKRFFQPVRDMAMFYNAFQSASAALEKISGLLEEVPSVRPPARPVALPSAQGHVRFDDVTFGYGSGRTILPHLELDVPAGQTVALVGSTGAGKSTLAKLVTRFYDVTAGAITLDGVDLRDLSTPDLRRAVVMVTQEAYLFSGSVRENIALARPDASDEEIERAARAVGAHDFILDLPDGYDTDVNKRGGRVSAGQRQLISFARAFLADPAVLILDEATSSLDIPGERLVQRGLETLLANRTAIIIAHRLSTVAIADRVLVMADGRIVEDGPPAELIAGSGRFAALHAAWRDSLV